MRKLCLLLLLLISFGKLSAQPKGFKSVSNLSQFQQNLAHSTSTLQSLTTDFTQTKHLSLLSDKIVSYGKFYYRKEDKVRIEYTRPFQYLLVMNGGQILVRDEQKSSHINTRTSKIMQSVNRIMIDCMRGSVFSNPDFKVSAYENASVYLLNLVPANETMKKMFSGIEVYLNKTSLDVNKLSMKEPGGDFTDMDFSKSQHNLVLNDALFKVR